MLALPLSTVNGAGSSASPRAGLPEVRKTLRALHRLMHTDKGGDGELSRLINMAAEAARMEAEAQERWRRAEEARARRVRAERTRSNRLMVHTVHERTRNKLPWMRMLAGHSR